ncbi:MAG: DUF485 domain-containing protein [Limisphaerales bacterium]
MQQPEGAGGDRVHSEEFLQSLMSRQLRLSVTCAAAFLVMLVGLPLANFMAPEWMATRVFGGFTLTWFLLGIGCFPAVWLIAWIFMRRSIALEDEEVDEIRNPGGGGAARRHLRVDARKGAERLMKEPPRF